MIVFQRWYISYGSIEIQVAIILVEMCLSSDNTYLYFSAYYPFLNIASVKLYLHALIWISELQALFQLLRYPLQVQNYLVRLNKNKKVKN